MSSIARLSVLFLLISMGAGPPHPNDSVFSGKGDHLVPLQETDIALKREVLDMKMRDGTMHVNVLFEFFNPGESKQLTVGFVNPPVAEGGEKGDPGAKDFLAIKDGEELETKVGKIGETGFQSAFGEDMARKEDYVNYFELEFDPGLNVLKHHYTYRGTEGAMGEQRLHYRLTTGKNWANEQIDHFQLNIDMGKELFELNRHFEEGEGGMNWEVVGEGNVREKKGSSGEGGVLAYTTHNGYLSFQKKDFRPDQDLTIVRDRFSPMYKKLGTVGLYQLRGGEDEDPFMEMWGIVTKRRESVEEKMEKLSEYDASELRLLRNGFFAVHGYEFNDEGLKEHFERYIWYFPDPDVKPSMSILTEEQREWVKRIRELEESGG